MGRTEFWLWYTGGPNGICECYVVNGACKPSWKRKQCGGTSLEQKSLGAISQASLLLAFSLPLPPPPSSTSTQSSRVCMLLRCLNGSLSIPIRNKDRYKLLIRKRHPGTFLQHLLCAYCCAGIHATEVRYRVTKGQVRRGG